MEENENIVQDQLDKIEETASDVQNSGEVSAVQNSGETSAPNVDYSDNDPDINLQKMREAKEALENQLAEQAREVERLRQLHQQQQKPQQSEEPSPNYLLGEDDVVEGRDYNRVYNKLSEMEKKFKQTQDQIEENMVNTQLSNDYPDYKDVVTTKNVEKLLKKYPEFADALAYNKNKYTQYKTAYRLIKQFGDVAQPKATQEKQMIQQNKKKPAPANAIGNKSTGNPLDHAYQFENGLTEERKRELQRLNAQACLKY